MSRFQVSQVGGSGGGGSGGDGGKDGGDVVGGIPNDGSNGIENPAMDPVELNVYGMYSKRNSAGCPTQGELKRKSSYGFTQITR